MFHVKHLRLEEPSLGNKVKPQMDADARKWNTYLIIRVYLRLSAALRDVPRETLESDT